MNWPTKSITHIVSHVPSLSISIVEDRLAHGKTRCELMMKTTNITWHIPSRIVLAVTAILILQISAGADTFTVTNTNDGGPGSLRQAIIDTGKTDEFDRIEFSIPLSDQGCSATTRVCTIRPGEGFPFLTNLEIDGYTQPGARANTLAQGTDAVLKIEIRGHRENPGCCASTAFVLLGGGAVIKGLIINNFSGHGLGVYSGNKILGCFIGTDATGTIAVPNGRSGGDGEGGIALAANLRDYGPAFIGTVSPADRNIISGNAGNGITIPGEAGSDSFVNSNQIQNNLIGTKADGISPLGNGGHGIYMRNNTSTSMVGNLIANNVIAFNGGIGINVADGGVGTRNSPLHNRISANSIHSNGNLGINLGYFLGGVDVNDPCDSDVGWPNPNDLQNHPVLTTASVRNGQYLIGGFLNSNPGGTYTIEFFASDACDVHTTKGEGKTFLGAIPVTVGGQDCASDFSAPIPITPGAGKVITATATSPAGDTSEFSGCIVAGADCANAPAGQVSWHRAEGNANDSQGVNHGTLENNVTFAPGFGGGQAFSFDGVGDKISVPDSPSLNFGTGSFTFETWARFKTTEGSQVIAQKKTISSAGWQLAMFQNVIRLSASPPTCCQGISLNSNTLVYPEDWFHVAFVVDRTTNTARLYVNGALQTTQQDIAGLGPLDFPSPFTIGGDDQDHYFNGLIDETTIYNRALSDAEIQSIYYAGGAGKCSPSDRDNDGVVDQRDNCPSTFNSDQRDTDNDGHGDVCDTDDDGDSFSDEVETAAGSDPLNARSTPEVCDGRDNDLNEGIDEGFPDTDGGGLRDCVDPDDDQDGQMDADEIACGSDPLIATSKSPDLEGDNVPDCVDTDDDGDNRADVTDNCPRMRNTQQEDADGDFIGDVCDPIDNPDVHVVFSSNRAGNFEIHGMRASGRGVVRLTNSPGDDIEPALSPNKTKIAFTSARDGNYEIYVMNVDGGCAKRLTDNARLDRNPAWSPDGRKIAFTSTRDGNSKIYFLDVVDCRDTATPTATLLNDQVGIEPAWSPDGSRIAFTGPGWGRLAVLSMNAADGSDLRTLTSGNEHNFHPTWSPDGSRIAFIKLAEPTNQLYTMNPDGTDVRRLFNRMPVSEPVWGANGKIAFRSTHGQDIYWINSKGTGLTRMTTHAAFDGWPHW